MSEQQFEGNSANIASGTTTTESVKEAATDAFAKASEAVRDTGAAAKQAVTQTASTVGNEVRGMLDRQLSESWGVAGQVATSFKRAADDLDRTSPMAAGVVRNLAEKVQGYAEEFQDQSVDQIVRGASAFARRQPALAFGLGAVAGFLMFRTLKTVQADVVSTGEAQRTGGRMPGQVESHYG